MCADREVLNEGIHTAAGPVLGAWPAPSHPLRLGREAEGSSPLALAVLAFPGVVLC